MSFVARIHAAFERKSPQKSTNQASCELAISIHYLACAKKMSTFETLQITLCSGAYQDLVLCAWPAKSPDLTA